MSRIQACWRRYRARRSLRHSRPASSRWSPVGSAAGSGMCTPRCTSSGGPSSTVARKSSTTSSRGRPRMTASPGRRLGRDSTRSRVGDRSTWLPWRRAWPPCSPDGGIFDAGHGPPYNPSGDLTCSGGAVLTTVPEGPSACVIACDPLDAGTCTREGTVCSGQTPFPGGMCVAGCLHDDTDCAANHVCETCQQQCIPAGSATAKIGDACAQDTDCPSGASCFTSPGFLMEGYCTQSCVAGGGVRACTCPAGSSCSQLGFSSDNVSCLQSCPVIGDACGQNGFVCQPGSGEGQRLLAAVRGGAVSGWLLRYLPRPHAAVQLRHDDRGLQHPVPGWRTARLGCGRRPSRFGR